MCETTVVLEGAIVGAGRLAGELFRDAVWRGGDKTDGDVACMGDVSCVLCWKGTGAGKEGCDVSLG